MKRKSEVIIVDENNAATNNSTTQLPPSKRKRRRSALQDQSNLQTKSNGENDDLTEVDLLNEMGVSPLTQQTNLTTELKTKNSIPNPPTNRVTLYHLFQKTNPSLHSTYYDQQHQQQQQQYKQLPDLFNKLQDEVIINIFKWLNKSTLGRCALVCKRWRRVSYDESLWKRLDLATKSLCAGDIGQILHRGTVVLRLARAMIASPAFIIPIPKSKLQYLDLSMAAIETDALEDILRCTTSLKKISLEHCTVTDDVCLYLSRNVELKVCHLGMVQGITETGLTTLLDSLIELEELNISWTNLSQEAIDSLSNHVGIKLRRLNVSGCKELLTDKHIEDMVQRVPNLRELDISDSTIVTSKSIEAITINLTKMEHLGVSRCYGIIPSSYLMLASCPTMLYLTVHGVMKDNAIKELKSRLPRIEINKHLFSTVARPTVGIRKTSIWHLKVRD